jgi:hypothetical protein
MPGLYIKFNFVLAPFAKTAEQLGANVGSRELLLELPDSRLYNVVQYEQAPEVYKNSDKYLPY